MQTVSIAQKNLASDTVNNHTLQMLTYMFSLGSLVFWFLFLSTSA